jgi:hypothetical protein
MRESLRIVAVCMLAAVGYGILHDLITAHVCVEYFTEWHPQIVSSRNPVVLALVWGVVATWWVGALLGVLLAIVARAGSRYPKLALSQLARPIAYVLGITGVAALALGLAGYWSVCAWGAPPFVPPADAVDYWRPCCAVARAHEASYGVGMLASAVALVCVYRQRTRRG